MLLTITTDHSPATDLGYLLHKHPGRMQSFDMSFGKAQVFYPTANNERCTACLLLDVDAVGLARARGRDQRSLLSHYVNDRPYAASSFMSVAISQVFGSALQGRCKDRPELVETPIPLMARIDVLPVRGGEAFLQNVFSPPRGIRSTSASPSGAKARISRSSCVARRGSRNCSRTSTF